MFSQGMRLSRNVGKHSACYFLMKDSEVITGLACECRKFVCCVVKTLGKWDGYIERAEGLSFKLEVIKCEEFFSCLIHLTWAS